MQYCQHARHTSSAGNGNLSIVGVPPKLAVQGENACNVGARVSIFSARAWDQNCSLLSITKTIRRSG